MRPVVDWARAETENTSSVKVVNSNREAAVILPSEDEAALTVLDSIGTPPCFWSDSHTTIGETVSSKFNFWIGSVNNLIGPGVPGKSRRKKPILVDNAIFWGLASLARCVVASIGHTTIHIYQPYVHTRTIAPSPRGYAV
jgi:hypothetical protein